MDAGRSETRGPDQSARLGASPQPLPLRRRVLLRVVGVMLAALVLTELAILVPMTLRERRELRERFYVEADREAWKRVHMLADALMPPRPDATRIAFLARMETVESAVWDASGRRVYHSPGWIPTSAEAEARRQIDQNAPSYVKRETEGTCYALYPLRDGGGRFRGVLAVSKPAGQIEAATWGFILKVLGTVLVISVVTGAALWVFLQREVLSPVQTLIGANLRAAGGAAGTLIPPDRIPNTELGQIMRTRNEMLLSLERARGEILAKNRELEHLNKTLEQRVAERTAELESTRERVVHIEKLAAIGRLAASVAHEVNNPLGIIAAGTEDLKRLIASLPPSQTGFAAEAQRSLDIVESQIGRCKAIVDSLLRFSRRRPSPPEIVEVGSFLEETVGLLEHRARGEGKSIALEVDAPRARIGVMRTQLQQALVNLLDNALEASRPGQTVTLRASVTEAHLAIEIEDRGEGIPNELKARIFEPFFTTRAPGQGSGMGLTIAEQFVRVQGGEIDCDSEPGRGTVFRLRVPAEPAA